MITSSTAIAIRPVTACSSVAVAGELGEDRLRAEPRPDGGDRGDEDADRDRAAEAALRAEHRRGDSGEDEHRLEPLAEDDDGAVRDDDGVRLDSARVGRVGRALRRVDHAADDGPDHGEGEDPGSPRLEPPAPADAVTEDLGHRRNPTSLVRLALQPRCIDPDGAPSSHRKSPRSFSRTSCRTMEPARRCGSLPRHDTSARPGGDEGHTPPTRVLSTAPRHGLAAVNQPAVGSPTVTVREVGRRLLRVLDTLAQAGAISRGRRRVVAVQRRSWVMAQVGE